MDDASQQSSDNRPSSANNQSSSSSNQSQGSDSNKKTSNSKTIDKLSVIASTKSKILRNGIVEEIDINNIVLDDVIIFEMGNQVVVDSIILYGSVEVNESFITGEADTVIKNKGGMLLNKIGKRLKQERLKNNLTLETLSNMTNISISTLSNIENNKIENISGVFLYRLSKAFNIDYDYLTRQRWDILPTFLYERNHKFASK